jgi:hypothetical protein
MQSVRGQTGLKKNIFNKVKTSSDRRFTANKKLTDVEFDLFVAFIHFVQPSLII